MIGVEDDAFGQRLKGFVVFEAGVEGDTEVLRQHVREQLANYKVPREIVVMETLPRNASGKVVKRDLPAD